MAPSSNSQQSVHQLFVYGIVESGTPVSVSVPAGSDWIVDVLTLGGTSGAEQIFQIQDSSGHYLINQPVNSSVAPNYGAVSLSLALVLTGGETYSLSSTAAGIVYALQGRSLSPTAALL